MDHVAVNLSLWGGLWPYGTTEPEWYTDDTPFGIPWQYNYVQNDPALDGRSITIFLNENSTWIGLHWLGGIPITPYHLWRYVTQAKSITLDSWANTLSMGLDRGYFSAETLELR